MFPSFELLAIMNIRCSEIGLCFIVAEILILADENRDFQRCAQLPKRYKSLWQVAERDLGVRIIEHIVWDAMSVIAKCC